ncbi:MAG: hypothetical protein OEY26_10150 [Nitrospinota bacterium]|jgi:uncharacterized membrane protein|nr:hypothetical protein [Nitrospinota bacterium]
METLQCTQCEKEFDHQLEQCPHCGTPVPIPNYPRFGGGGVFIAMWVFFVVLIIVLLVSMFTV